MQVICLKSVQFIVAAYKNHSVSEKMYPSWFFSSVSNMLTLVGWWCDGYGMSGKKHGDKRKLVVLTQFFPIHFFIYTVYYVYAITHTKY